MANPIKNIRFDPARLARIYTYASRRQQGFSGAVRSLIDHALDDIDKLTSLDSVGQKIQQIDENLSKTVKKSGEIAK